MRLPQIDYRRISPAPGLKDVNAPAQLANTANQIAKVKAGQAADSVRATMRVQAVNARASTARVEAVRLQGAAGVNQAKFSANLATEKMKYRQQQSNLIFQALGSLTQVYANYEIGLAKTEKLRADAQMKSGSVQINNDLLSSPNVSAVDAASAGVDLGQADSAPVATKYADLYMGRVKKLRESISAGITNDIAKKQFDAETARVLEAYKGAAVSQGMKLKHAYQVDQYNATKTLAVQAGDMDLARKNIQNGLEQGLITSSQAVVAEQKAVYDTSLTQIDFAFQSGDLKTLQSMNTALTATGKPGPDMGLANATKLASHIKSLGASLNTAIKSAKTEREKSVLSGVQSRIRDEQYLAKAEIKLLPDTMQTKVVKYQGAVQKKQAEKAFNALGADPAYKELANFAQTMKHKYPEATTALVRTVQSRMKQLTDKVASAQVTQHKVEFQNFIKAARLGSLPEGQVNLYAGLSSLEKDIINGEAKKYQSVQDKQHAASKRYDSVLATGFGNPGNATDVKAVDARVTEMIGRKVDPSQAVVTATHETGILPTIAKNAIQTALSGGSPEYLQQFIPLLRSPEILSQIKGDVNQAKIAGLLDLTKSMLPAAAIATWQKTMAATPETLQMRQAAFEKAFVEDTGGIWDTIQNYARGVAQAGGLNVFGGLFTTGAQAGGKAVPLTSLAGDEGAISQIKEDFRTGVLNRMVYGNMGYESAKVSTLQALSQQYAPDPITEAPTREGISSYYPQFKTKEGAKFIREDFKKELKKVDTKASMDMSRYSITYSITDSNRHGKPVFSVWEKNAEGFPVRQVGLYEPPVDAYDKHITDQLNVVHKKALERGSDVRYYGLTPDGYFPRGQ